MHRLDSQRPHLLVANNIDKAALYELSSRGTLQRARNYDDIEKLNAGWYAMRNSAGAWQALGKTQFTVPRDRPIAVIEDGEKRQVVYGTKTSNDWEFLRETRSVPSASESSVLAVDRDTIVFGNRWSSSDRSSSLRRCMVQDMQSSQRLAMSWSQTMGEHFSCRRTEVGERAISSAARHR